MAKQKKKWIKWLILAVAAACILALSLFLVIKLVPFGTYDLLPSGGTELKNGTFNYDLPLDNKSPWPKFRANALQNGCTPVEPKADASVQPWEFRTEKGIFSSPVVDADGTAYVGSADRFFYAIKQDGTVKWKVETGEIIDSSAVLDDKGRVYFGSGDAKVYAVDRETGEVLWTQQAATTAEVNEEFGITTYNVNWYEGNVGIMPDGTILAPNDNYLLYRLNRDTGEAEQRYLSNEMIWSLPNYNPKTGRLFFGSIYPLFDNILCYDAKTGEQIWKTGGIGATAATTLLTSHKETAGVIVGSYDGTLRALAQKSGKTLWKQALRDHIYASPAQLSDGTIIQPSADGTVYAFDPTNGEQLWAFDTLEPIRSSPAVDAKNQIYFGSGEGKLFCLNPDGSLRWSYQCILEGRNDLNASPALGYDGVYIAGESGEIFFVPYDYPLRPENADDPRCAVELPMPGDGGHMIYTEPLGGLRTELPESIEANHALTFTLVARRDGNTIAGQMNSKAMKVEIPGNDDFTIQISADKRYMILIPKEHWIPDADGNLTVNITGKYKVDQSRYALLFFWGKKGGELKESFRFAVNNNRAASENPFLIPKDGSPAATIELRRQSAPHPSLLPSLAQIGFDSLHYLMSPIGTLGDQTLFWVISGKVSEDGSVVPNVGWNDRFPILMDYANGLTTFYNYDGLKANFVAAWDVPIAAMRVGAAFDPATRKFDPVPTYNATGNCDEVAFYGPGMKLMGISELIGGKLYASGSLELVEREPAAAPKNPGTVAMRFDKDANALTADLTGSGLKIDGHVFSIMVTSPKEDKMMLLPYASGITVKEADRSGMVASVSLDLGKKHALQKGQAYEVYLIADTYPVAVQEVVY